jgi:ribosomal protein S12 methylthiotransferase accessory factor
VEPRASVVANAVRAVAERAGHSSGGAPAHSEGLDLEDGRAAQALALIEGLERLFALEYCEPGRVVQASYREVAGGALDPAAFPLYAEDQYAERGFGVRKFDAGQPLEWIWGMRVADSQPLLVPKDLVYGRGDGARIYCANSNGAACHSSFHRAVLGGIYETVERDAFLVAWMNRLSLPVLATGAESEVRKELDALSLELKCVDITTDLKIPVVLGVLTDQRNPDFLLVDPVASLSQAARDAKLDREMTQFVRPYLSDTNAYVKPATASFDPMSVKTFPDHPAFYQNRKKIRHAKFLTAGPRKKTRRGPMRGAPLTVEEELQAVLARLSQRGYPVVVVDCAVPMLRELGLYAVKVLIPGLQPLNAGHRYAVLGGRRVYEAPRRMGLAQRDRRRAELNPWPHPFW